MPKEPKVNYQTRPSDGSDYVTLVKNRVVALDEKRHKESTGGTAEPRKQGSGGRSFSAFFASKMCSAKC